MHRGCSISQPWISKQLKGLAKALGGLLIERTRWQQELIAAHKNKLLDGQPMLPPSLLLRFHLVSWAHARRSTVKNAP